MKESDSMTTSELMDDALLGKFFMSMTIRPRSVEDYTHSIKAFFGYLVRQEVERPTREHVLAYRDSLIRTGKKASTIHSYIIPLRVFFRWLACEEIYANIAEQVRAPGGCGNDSHRRDAMNARQTLLLLNSVDQSTIRGLRDYAMLMLMVIGGLRCVEVSRAQVGDFTKRGNDTVLYVYGKGREDSQTEYVRLPGSVSRALRAYLKKRGETTQEAPLFVSTGNRNAQGPLSTRSISKIVKNAMRNAGYDSDRLCAHSLRHTAITLALKGGEKMEAVKSFARHASVSTTLIYSHAIDREHCTCTRTIEKAIFGARKRR